MGSGRIHVFVMSTNDKLQLELDLLDQNKTLRMWQSSRRKFVFDELREIPC